MNNKIKLGRRIKEIRKAKGLTQEKLAEIIGIETGSLSAIESGRHFPSLLTLEKVATFFDVELQLFFEFSTNLTQEEMIQKTIENLSQIKPKDLYCLYKASEFYKSM